MNMDETTEECAIRELEEETGLRLSKIQQIGAYSKVDRDPRGRTITVAYFVNLATFRTFASSNDGAARAESNEFELCRDSRAELAYPLPFATE